LGFKEKRFAGGGKQNFEGMDTEEEDLDLDSKVEEMPAKKRKTTTVGLLTPGAIPAARPLVYVHMVDPDNVGPPLLGAPYPWCGVLTWPAYTGVLAYTTMRE